MAELLDVVVISAGPAGLIGAECLAEEDFRVVVLEREAKPNYGKLCGGYMPALVFEEFEIPRSLADYSVRGLGIVTRGGEWCEELDEVVGFNVIGLGLPST